MDKITIEKIIELCSRYDISSDVILALYCIFHGIKVSHIIKDYDRFIVELTKYDFELLRSNDGINLSYKPESLKAKELIQAIKGDDININKPVVNSKSFAVTKELFNDFFESYPIKVNSVNGSSRILRAATANSLNYERIFNKYRSKIKTEQDHLNAIKGLKAYVKLVNPCYYQNLETFVNQASWEMYLDVDVTNKSDVIYKDE